MKTKIITISTVLLLIISGTYFFPRWWKKPLYDPIYRGEKIAKKMGCFACHGPQGTKGILNPGSFDGTIPAWDGGTLMMYAENVDEIREWILYGSPKRLRDNPNWVEEQSKALIHMPAYEGIINESQLNDLVSYFTAISWATKIEEDPLAQKGRIVALENGCFGCHGPEGKYPMPNPGSLKGYIPPWNSKDFNELVKNDAELEEWILNGSIQRFDKNPLAQFFLKRQQLQMPAYKNHLTQDELNALKAFIKWVNAPTKKEEIP